MKEFKVNKNDAGQRLDRFVAKAVPLLPASLIQKYIRLKRIKVGGKGSKREYKLLESDIIQMYINDEFFELPTEENAYLKVNDPDLSIVYEDENILLINKPIGMLCHSDSEIDLGTLVTRVKAYLYQNKQWIPKDENSFTPALCNRIDRNTSGIVIAVKNAESLRIMNEKIKNHEIDKFYLAIVHGIPKAKSARLTDFLFKDSVKNRVYILKNSKPGAKTAIMEYKIISNTSTLSLLECYLITGRTHQIRAQLAALGYPILGDSKYGNERENKPYGETKQALCSYKIKFSFKSDAGILNYLKNKEFDIDNIDFVSRYFG